MKNAVWMLIFLLLLIVGMSGGCSKAPEGFAIYLTRDDTPVSEMAKLDKYKLAAEPVVSIDGMISYTRDTHEIELTADAFALLTTMKVPTSGKAFVVCVGKKQIYWGAFWAPYSSQSFDGVIILVPALSKGNVVELKLGYPSPGFYQGKDPRSNPEIFRSLEKAGKLK